MTYITIEITQSPASVVAGHLDVHNPPVLIRLIAWEESCKVVDIWWVSEVVVKPPNVEEDILRRGQRSISGICFAA